MSVIDDFNIEMSEFLQQFPSVAPNDWSYLLTFQQGSHHLLKQREILKTSPTFTTKTNSWLVSNVSEHSNV